jgi:glycerophosphoryl diester phosphodiesterase
MELSARTIMGQSLRDFRRTWPQLILTDLLARVLGIIVLTPVVGLLLSLFLATTSTGVVTDGAIVGFLLHPIGLSALLIVSVVALGILFAETGQLMVIGFGSIEDRRATWLEALKYAFGHVRALIDLAWFGVVRLLPISLPFLAAVGALYWFLLRTYDINYYLTRKPPVFLAVVVVAGLLLTVMALLIIIRIAGWLLALPMVLFEGMGGRQAMRASKEATAAHRRKFALWLVGWIVAVILLSALVTFVAGRLGGGLISRESSSLTVLVVGLSAVFVVSGLANLAVMVCSTALFPLLVVRLYRSVAGPGELNPEIAARGTLGEKATWRIPGKTILWAGAVALVVIAVGGYMTMRGLDWGDQAQIIAHRGGAGVAPENTMAAFKRGIADGTDWLELDVQENAAGVVVIEHDRDFMRVAGANLEVWKATDVDLADLDVGSFFGPSFSNQRVPTLREVLELAKGQAGVFIELKYYGHNRSLEEKVVDLVEETGMASDIVIMSLDYEGVRRAAALRPTWTYGLLNTVALGDLTHLDVDFLGLTANASSYWTVRHAHRSGMKVYAWTIDDPVQMSVMMSRGVDGIITNQVALARQVQELRAKLTPLGRFVVWMAGETGMLRGIEKSSVKDEV